MIETCFEYNRISHDSQMQVENDENLSINTFHVLRLLFILIGNHGNNLEYMEPLWTVSLDLTLNIRKKPCDQIEYQHFAAMLDLLSIWIGLKGGSRILGTND